MLIDDMLCIGCGLCIPYCPVEAISPHNEKAIVDLHKCVECGVCFRSGICPTDAIIRPEKLDYPRSLRRYFSDPTITKKETGLPGRGTEEVKTNDVTGRVTAQEIGFCIEVGRPGVSASFNDVQRVTMSLAKLGVEFEDKNPITYLMTNRESGELREKILGERVLSVIIEFKVKRNEVDEVIDLLRQVEKDIKNVFTVGLITTVSQDGTIPVLQTLERLNVKVRPNAKINVGLGKPLVQETRVV